MQVSRLSARALALCLRAITTVRPHRTWVWEERRAIALQYLQPSAHEYIHSALPELFNGLPALSATNRYMFQKRYANQGWDGCY